MAVVTIVDLGITSAVTLPANVWTSILGGAQSVIGLGGGASVIGYANDVDFSAALIRIVIDGTDVTSGGIATPTVTTNHALSIGTHTIDVQVFPFNNGQTSSDRGCVAFTL